MKVKPMPEHMLLDIIHDRNDMRKEFPDWQHVVDEQICLLYKFKEKQLQLERRVKKLDESAQTIKWTEYYIRRLYEGELTEDDL